MTVATLAMSGNLDEARLLLIAVANGVDWKSGANFTKFCLYFVRTRRLIGTERF